MKIKNCNNLLNDCACDAIPMECCPFKKLVFDILNGKTKKELLENVDFELGANDVFCS